MAIVARAHSSSCALVLITLALLGPASANPDERSLAIRLLSIIDASDDYGDRHFLRDVSDEVCPWITKEDLEGLVSSPGPEFTAHFDDLDPKQRTYWLKKTASVPSERKGIQVGLGDKECYAYVRRADAI